MSVDYYALLGVPKFCSSQDEIRRAYLAQARFFHPDAGNVTPEIAHQKMQQLNTIYDTLKDPDARRLYDAKLLSPVKAEASPSFSTSPAPPTQPPRHASRAPSRFKQTVVALASIAATLFGCLVLICISSNIGKPSATTVVTAEAINTPVTAQPSFPPASTMKPFPVPDSGEVLYHDQQDRVAPFTIETSGSGYYVVKLKDHISGVDVLCVFIHAGDIVDVDVPLGDFDLFYASGDVWYGLKRLFGDATVCSKSTSLFDFSEIGGYVSGWTVTLYPVYNGNMQTISIDIDEF